MAKKMKKYPLKCAALLLVMVLLLSACGGGADSPVSDPGAPGAPDAPAADVSDPVADSPPAAGDNFNPTGMPIVNEPVELTVLTMRWGAMGDSFTQNAWLQELEERTNVKINWIAVSNEGWDEARSLMLLSGDVPDIFMGNQTIHDGHVLSYLHLFRDLTQLIEDYMPNYRAALEAIPMLRQITTYPDGGIYSFAKNLPSRPMTRNQLVINTEWLNNLGLDAPTDMASFENMLRAFKNDDPNGNGIADEIPFSFNGDRVPLDFYQMFGFTDINATNMIMRDGVPQFFATMDEYRDAISWMHGLYSEGLIDNVGFTQSWDDLGNKWRNDEIPIVGMMWQWSYDAVTGKWADQYDIYPPIVGPYGRQYAEGDRDGVYSLMRNEAHITVNCEHPEIAARWLDEFYEFEASIQNFWGAINTVITRHDDGTFTLNDPPEGTSADGWYWDQSLRDFGPKFIPPGYSDRIIFDSSRGDGRKLVDSLLSDPFIVEQYPLVIFTPEENETLSILSQDIMSYVDQMHARWVTQGGVEEEWDAYIEQLNLMNLDEFVRIYREAYNRFAR